MTETEKAWAAGLFEGEGGISCYTHRDGYWQRRIQLDMTDQDIVERFAQLVGVGYVTTRPPRNGRKQQWRWILSRWNDQVAFAEWIAPLLGKRRQAQLNNLLSHPPTRSTPS